MAVVFTSCDGATTVSGVLACPAAAGLLCARSGVLMEDELLDVELAELVAVLLRQKGGLDLPLTLLLWLGSSLLEPAGPGVAASPILRPRMGQLWVASPLLIACHCQWRARYSCTAVRLPAFASLGAIVSGYAVHWVPCRC